MSIEAVRAVLTRSKAKGSARMVLVALAERANADGLMWPSVPTLAQDTNICERMVQYHLRALCKSGEITLEDRATGGRARSAVYRLCLPPSEHKGCNELHPKDPKRVQPMVERVQSIVVKGAMNCTRTVKEPSGNLPPNPPDSAPAAADLGLAGVDSPERAEAEQRKAEQRATKSAEGAAKRALMARVGAIVHRQPETGWSERENKALATLYPIPEPDLAAVEAYYAKHWPPNRERNILRHDLGTLLNNWRTEVDRARAERGKRVSNGPAWHSPGTNGAVVPVPDVPPEEAERLRREQTAQLAALKWTMRMPSLSGPGER